MYPKWCAMACQGQAHICLPSRVRDLYNCVHIPPCCLVFCTLNALLPKGLRAAVGRHWRLAAQGPMAAFRQPPPLQPCNTSGTMMGVARIWLHRRGINDALAHEPWADLRKSVATCNDPFASHLDVWCLFSLRPLRNAAVPAAVPTAECHTVDPAPMKDS